jgi:hypothetical protein
MISLLLLLLLLLLFDRKKKATKNKFLPEKNFVKRKKEIIPNEGPEAGGERA